MAPNNYNITVYDQSPTVVYTPYRDGPVDSSWRVYYSNSPESSYDETHTDTNLSSGSSLHSTTFSGATMEIEWMGTAIYLYGSGSAGAYKTTLDSDADVSGDPSNGLLFSKTGLTYAAHKLTLTTTSTNQLNFTSAILTVGIGEEGASISNSKKAAVNVASDGTSSLNSYFTTSGNGPFSTDHDASGYPRIDTTGDGSKILFSFSDASALFVYGTANYDHGAYSVSLNPSAGVSTSDRTFNDTSRWFAYDQLVYWETDLNRSLTYQVTFTNQDEGKYMDIHSVTLYDAVPSNSSTSSPSGSDSSATATGSSSGSTETSASSDNGGSSISTGAIAGIAIAGVAALLVGLGFLFWWRRNSKKKEREQASYGYGPGSTPMNQFHDANGASGFAAYPSQAQPLLSGYVEPFVMPPGTESPHASKYDTSRTATSTMYSDTPLVGATASSSHLSYHLTPEGMHATPSDAGGSSNSGSGKGGPPTAAPRPVRQEQDAGPAPEPAVNEEEVLPPGYNPEWVAGGSGSR